MTLRDGGGEQWGLGLWTPECLSQAVDAGFDYSLTLGPRLVISLRGVSSIKENISIQLTDTW